MVDVLFRDPAADFYKVNVSVSNGEVSNRLKAENLEDEKVFFGMVENVFYP